MREKPILGTILTLSLAFIVLAACIAPAFALTTHIEHLNAAGTSLIDIPGQTNIMVVAQHIERSDFYAGSADRIQLMVSAAPSGMGPPFKYVTAYEDNPARFAFSQEVGKGGLTALNLVGRCQIQVFRICKTVFVYWTVPLVMPATGASPLGPPTPAVTLPSGCLMLQGYGDAQSFSPSSQAFPLSGWSVKGETTGYSAKATLFCPCWHYWGAVAETAISSPSVVTDGTLTWTHP